jgi:hypothetical protein
VGVLLVLSWTCLGEERSGFGVLAERSGLHWVHWLNRVSQRKLLRKSETTEGQLTDTLVGAPLTTELLSESSVLDLQKLTDSTNHSLLCASKSEEHEKGNHQEEEDCLEDVAPLVVSSPLSRAMSTPVATHILVSSVVHILVSSVVHPPSPPSWAKAAMREEWRGSLSWT